MKYDIIANYCTDNDITMHFLKFRRNNETFQAPNIMSNYITIFHKALPKYDIPTFSDIAYDTKRDAIYIAMLSKGNPFQIKEPLKDIRINLYDINKANIDKRDITEYFQYPAPYTSYPTFN